MSEVLRGQIGIVVLGKVVGSVAVAQTIVRPISSDDLLGLVPLPLEVDHLLKRTFATFDELDPLDELLEDEELLLPDDTVDDELDDSMVLQ